MIVYADEDDSYITYITPSAYRELAEWMKYREESGEIILIIAGLCVIYGILELR
jgi:hypothetical protein